MRLTRSRLVAVCAVVLAAAGGVYTAGSLASGRAPAAAHRAAALYLQDVVVKNFGGRGLYANLTSSAHVVVEDSLFSRCFQGVEITSSGTVDATIEHSRFEDGGSGGHGVLARTNSDVIVRDSV